MSINHPAVCIMVSMEHKHCPPGEEILEFIEEKMCILSLLVNVYAHVCASSCFACVCTCAHTPMLFIKTELEITEHQVVTTVLASAARRHVVDKNQN
jgi:hypothetical protein